VALATKPPPEVGTASLLPVAVVHRTIKQPKEKECVEWVVALMRLHPKRPPKPLADLREQAKSKFGVNRRLFEEGDNCVLRQGERRLAEEGKTVDWRRGGRRPK
jgi:hypothetical protein